jgi:hypothetical protein
MIVKREGRKWKYNFFSLIFYIEDLTSNANQTNLEQQLDGEEKEAEEVREEVSEEDLAPIHCFFGVPHGRLEDMLHPNEPKPLGFIGGRILLGNLQQVSLFVLQSINLSLSLPLFSSPLYKILTYNNSIST